MNDAPFWNEEWMQTQRKYWEAWSEMSRKALGLENAPKPPLESALEHWWQGVSASAGELGRDFMEKMMEQGRGFFHMAESYYRNAAESHDWLEAANRTVSELRRSFEEDVEKRFSGGATAGEDALKRMMAFWERPLDNWRCMVSSLSLLPGELLRNLSHNEVLEGFLNMPGLGYLREEEEQYQSVIRLVAVYQRALAEYMAFFSTLGLLSADRLRDKVQGLVDEGREVESARGLYDLWVGASEEVYTEQVMTSEYVKLHGELVNALMALKQELNRLADERLAALNMPTRRELHTLQDRLQESRRELRTLRREMEGLKEEVWALRGAGEKATPLATSHPPAKPRRNSSGKKRAPAQRKPRPYD